MVVCSALTSRFLVAGELVMRRAGDPDLLAFRVSGRIVRRFVPLIKSSRQRVVPLSTQRVMGPLALSPLVDLWYTLGHLITLLPNEDLHHAAKEWPGQAEDLCPRQALSESPPAPGSPALAGAYSPAAPGGPPRA